MHKSIRLKLFIAILLTTLLVVAGMYLFMRWSLDRGFNEFIETRQHARIEQLIQRLTDNYSQSGSWESLAKNKRQWMQLLRSNSPRHLHSSKWVQQTRNEPPNHWPPTLPVKNGTGRFTPLNFRLMLLDTEKSPIFGRQEDIAQLTLHPIHFQQNTIGYLGILPGQAIEQLGELQFMDQQAKALIWITFSTIALSAGLALLLAYLFGRPLKKITLATKELGMGKYAMRLPVESNDELGQLAQDFNEMAAALEQSEKSRQRWIADVSHELRTPLAILRGELEALQDGIRPMDKTAVNSLSSDIMRLTRLTDDLYQLALSDHGALTYRKTNLNPITILKQSINGLNPEFNKKQITVRLQDNNNDNTSLFADPDRLAQLFQNLLTNSAKYTDDHGLLEITISKRKNTLFIDLNDSVPGIPQSELPKLFDKLYRVEKSRSRNLGGAGLGLAICSNIINAHHGTINATPSTLGGLAIHIELPIQP